MDHDRAPSVIGELHLRPWSDEESSAFEAAVEAIGAVIGSYSARIAEERAKDPPDQDQTVLDELRSRQRQCAHARRSLDPSDHDAVARARGEYGALAREMQRESRRA